MPHQDVHIPSLPDGSRVPYQDVQLPRLPHGFRMPYQDLQLHRLQLRLRKTLQAGSVYGLHAGLHDQDDQGAPLHLQEGSLHGHALCSASYLQAGSSDNLLPDACLLLLLLLQLGREPVPQGMREPPCDIRERRLVWRVWAARFRSGRSFFMPSPFVELEADRQTRGSRNRSALRPARSGCRAD